MYPNRVLPGTIVLVVLQEKCGISLTCASFFSYTCSTPDMELSRIPVDPIDYRRAVEYFSSTQYYW